MAAVVVTIAAVVAVVVALRITSAHKVDQRALDACHKIHRLNEQRGDPRPVTDGTVRAVVLGDSYSQGATLADARTQAWSTRIGRLEHWRTSVDAIGGTGFVNGGACGGEQFGTRVAAVLALRPDIVVVQGGLNDVGRPGLRAAAEQVLHALEPVPRVVLVGPPPAPARPEAQEAAVSRVLADVARRAGVRYVSAIGWRLQYGPDRLHPTAAGHDRFARLVAAALDSRSAG